MFVCEQVRERVRQRERKTERDRKIDRWRDRDGRSGMIEKGDKTANLTNVSPLGEIEKFLQ